MLRPPHCPYGAFVDLRDVSRAAEIGAGDLHLMCEIEGSAFRYMFFIFLFFKTADPATQARAYGAEPFNTTIF